MISYQWHLSPDQPFNKEELCRLQCCLYAAGIYLDLSWNEGSVIMSISVPEDLMEKVDAQQEVWWKQFYPFWIRFCDNRI